MKNDDSKTIVFHKKYGTGRILQRRYGGFKVLVKFDKDGIERWVRFNTIRYINNEDKIEQPEIENRVVNESNNNPNREESFAGSNLREVINTKRLNDAKNKSNDWFTSRCIIESLRLGIVPQGYIEEFTIGRERK